MKTLSIVLIIASFLSSCVSVKIGDNKTKKSTRYEYKSPDGPFYRIKDEAVDVAWLNEQTGSTISIKSKCQKNLSVDLDDWAMNLAAGLNNGKIISSETARMYNRKALKMQMASSLEGFDNRLAITTFVKNSCHYILALTSLPKSFDKDLNTYEQFLSEFRAW